MEISHLVKAAQKGDDQAFEELVSSVRTKLYRIAFSYVRNEQDALDLYQETIYEAYRSLRKLKKPESFISWIVRIVVCKAIDFIRKESRHFATSDQQVFDTLLYVENATSISQSLDLSHALSTLEPHYRMIIALRYYYDFSIKEIASLLHSPEGTVKSYISRAKKELRPILKEGYIYE